MHVQSQVEMVNVTLTMEQWTWTMMDRSSLMHVEDF